MARRRLIAFAALGIVSYAIAMVATMPASLALRNKPWRTGVAGTVWNGEVGVRGGTTVRWHWAPLRSLVALGFAADWHATGQDTDLDGQVLAGLHSVTLDHVSGSGTASLIEALQPALPFTCDLTGQAQFDRIVAGGSGQMMQGQATSDPGSCRPKGAGAASSLPPLILTAEHIGRESRIRLAPMAQRRKILLEATLSEDGNLMLSVSPEGAAMLPFLGMTPGVRVPLKL